MTEPQVEERKQKPFSSNYKKNYYYDDQAKILTDKAKTLLYKKNTMTKPKFE